MKKLGDIEHTKNEGEESYIFNNLNLCCFSSSFCFKINKNLYYFVLGL